ncbi:beta-glucoside-specific PTS transporter subunit IIABC [Tetragenococcus koreensis]|uniref:beta-glucoside-specific PTS transporter subunit IIABC n=1 Tax=Tetragenococcus koreensis TaxID=290335 RepID=UPI000F4E55A9|nr:beta-glucoside-specific PTS transporter subunit IIABC [Tetragenococcus koreensis]AYW45960.1 PTS beta-glucoside transporter subunit EIIBCA [Tetragenococcus koreensis]MCF1621342.1 beta-glucoside-specific PTS transporter subunit IIABC [Tetragenococcus koreensis]MCF1626408.1 beta-glucoside-specific PTS transporter subunit IIABC [Tetragenococcus koreensis]MCF1677392.1 beta-glucoside-specific PTS transporter subunit IIABC [Tetragenococcus koreensis]MCF1679737.1 beta-glucoside-specific PTS transpo
MAKDYKKLAKEIIEHVGGENNVSELHSCMTRLRFYLKDEDLADTDYLKNLEGVVTVIQASGQYQVVIGSDVGAVYEAILNNSNIDGRHAESTTNNKNKDRTLLDKFIDLISGIFQPFILVLSATGMIKGLVALLGVFGLNEANSGFYAVLNAVGDGFFQFLPVVIALTAAKKFRMNIYSALAIAFALVYPSLSDLSAGEPLYTLFTGTPFSADVFTTFLGIPVLLPPGGYYSTVIPTILAIWFGAKVEKGFKKIIPSVVNSFLTPFFTVLVAASLAILVIGPVATWGTDLIGLVFMGIYKLSPLIFGALVGGLWQLLVMFGLHWGLAPIGILQLSEQGFTPILSNSGSASFGVLGVLLAIIIKNKDKNVRNIGIPATIASIFGVTEPGIYGLLLPMKKPFIIALISSAIGGAYTGFFDVVVYRIGGLGIFSITNYITDDGQITMNFWHRVISFILVTVIAFMIQMFMKTPQVDTNTEETGGKNSKQPLSKAELETSRKQEIIASPLDGELKNLTDVEDEVFASGAMGKGIAMMPSKGIIYAPTDAKVSMIFKTGHAIGLITELGTEILIHVGLDTVELEGEGFEKLVNEGDEVLAGQPLIRFEIDKIKQKGYKLDVPIIVTNTGEITEVLITEEKRLEHGDYLFTAVG